MAFGYTTYKTFAPVNSIYRDLTGKEGCGLVLTAEAEVDRASATTDVPYAILSVGATSVDGTYPGAPVAGSLELVDQLGCAVQALASDDGAISAGDLVIIDTAASVSGSFKANNSPAEGDYVWGMALTDCAAGEQFILRFNPSKTFAST